MNDVHGKEQPRYEQAGTAMTCRSYAEYAAMFDLVEDSAALQGPVLDVAGGASSFTAQLCDAGVDAVAADPRYALPPEQMLREAEEEIRTSTAKLEAVQEHFEWSYYGTLQHHERMRQESLKRFIRHYRFAARTEVYLPASLPNLPFADNRFALVVCSHFLFLYGDPFTVEFHEQALRELIRVCRSGGEVHVYPLISLPHFHAYPGLDELLERLLQDEVEVSRVRSRLPFILGSETQLVLRKKAGSDIR